MVDLPSIVEFLKSKKIAMQYIPKWLAVRSAMPATQSGKIQKFKLRQMLIEGTI
jgi:cyclohexanecarboxylate-CoA ligase